MAARGVLLKYLKVNVTSVPRNRTSAVGGDTGLFSVSFNAIRHRFSTEEVRGSFLDKSEVSDRVVSVVKNFQKVDPSQLKPFQVFASFFPHPSSLSRFLRSMKSKPLFAVSSLTAASTTLFTSFDIPSSRAFKSPPNPSFSFLSSSNSSSTTFVHHHQHSFNARRNPPPSVSNKMVKTMIKKPHNDHLPLIEASRLCNMDIISHVQQVICFAFHDSRLLMETCQEAKNLRKIVTLFYLD
ncbi:hypothetical protein LWI29_006574 [Acer saccharum]|uniref:Uncharacterized protein n=1 Tax=Acer saccharum TaxID=4024 RepID=A0AA39VSP7_ACESA|nr:hypothetical protein LWI29_006574 [Acer saccharum]